MGDDGCAGAPVRPWPGAAPGARRPRGGQGRTGDAGGPGVSARGRRDPLVLDPLGQGVLVQAGRGGGTARRSRRWRAARTAPRSGPSQVSYGSPDSSREPAPVRPSSAASARACSTTSAPRQLRHRRRPARARPGPRARTARSGRPAPAPRPRSPTKPCRRLREAAAQRAQRERHPFPGAGARRVQGVGPADDEVGVGRVAADLGDDSDATRRRAARRRSASARAAAARAGRRAAAARSPWSRLAVLATQLAKVATDNSTRSPVASS